MMADYIDRKALLEKIKKWYCLKCKTDDYCRACWVDDMIGEIEDAPAVNVAPVVHAKWEMRPSGENGSGEMKAFCTHCNKPNKQYQPPYCPHCGAKMEDDNAE